MNNCIVEKLFEGGQNGFKRSETRSRGTRQETTFIVQVNIQEKFQLRLGPNIGLNPLDVSGENKKEAKMVLWFQI